MGVGQHYTDASLSMSASCYPQITAVVSGMSPLSVAGALTTDEQFEGGTSTISGTWCFHCL